MLDLIDTLYSDYSLCSVFVTIESWGLTHLKINNYQDFSWKLINWYM